MFFIPILLSILKTRRWKVYSTAVNWNRDNQQKGKKFWNFFIPQKEEQTLNNNVSFSCITLIQMSHKIQQKIYYVIFISCEGSNTVWAQLFTTKSWPHHFFVKLLTGLFYSFIKEKNFFILFMIEKFTAYLFIDT